MAEALERIAYCSHSVASNADALPSLIQILAVSQRNNARDGISGALAVSRGRYFQVVEGPRVALNSLLQRIEKDSRHGKIHIVARHAIDHRLFGPWTMVAPRVTPELAAEIDRAVDECHVDSHHAIELLLDVVRKQAASSELIEP